MRDRGNEVLKSVEELAKSTTEQGVLRDQSFITTAVSHKGDYCEFRFPDGTIRKVRVNVDNTKNYVKAETANNVLHRISDEETDAEVYTSFLLQNTNAAGNTYDRVVATQIITDENKGKDDPPSYAEGNVSNAIAKMKREAG